MAKNRLLYGVPVSRGVAVGKAFVCDSKTDNPPEKNKSPEEHKLKLRAALKGAVQEIRDSSRLLPPEIKKIAEAQAALLEDTSLFDAAATLVDQGMDASASIVQVMDQMADRMQASGSDYMRDRASELRSLAREISRRIKGKREIPEDAVFVSKDITVPEALGIIRSGAKAVVLEQGAITSHAAIILRDYRIPTVIEVYEAASVVKDGQTLAVDGNQGMIVVEPDQRTVEDFQKRIMEDRREQQQLQKLVGLEAKTLNGHRIQIMMNLDLPEEVELVEKVGGCGVGLFRTEYLYLTGRKDEESQFEIYSKMAEALAPWPFTIRSFDMGGDKVLGIPESNPFLGLRGIRFLLSRPDILKAQLRAAVRANKHCNIRIMFPMVCSISELEGAKELLDEVLDEIKPQCAPKMGIMVETPSAVMLAREFAKRVDFMSIGTNDLTQYTLAVDRQNPRVSYLYQQLDPAVLRGIKMVVEAGREFNKPVAVCGELASDPVGALVLLSLGVKELSVAPPNYLRTKKLIMGISLSQIQDLGSRFLELTSADKVKRLARWVMKQKKIPA